MFALTAQTSYLCFTEQLQTYLIAFYVAALTYISFTCSSQMLVPSEYIYLIISVLSLYSILVLSL